MDTPAPTNIPPHKESHAYTCAHTLTDTRTHRYTGNVMTGKPCHFRFQIYILFFFISIIVSALRCSLRCDCVFCSNHVSSYKNFNPFTFRFTLRSLLPRINLHKQKTRKWTQKMLVKFPPKQVSLPHCFASQHTIMPKSTQQLDISSHPEPLLRQFSSFLFGILPLLIFRFISLPYYPLPSFSYFG